MGENVNERVWWIDCSKAYGIILVFYGHLIEQIWSITGYVAALHHYKFIYAFHMPLFFILSGYIGKQLHNTQFWQFLMTKVKKRLLPVLFLNGIALPFWLAKYVITYGSIDFRDLTIKILGSIRGLPQFNWMTWFLVCLFAVEIIDYFYYRFIKSNMRLLIVPIIYIIGWIMTHYKLLIFKVNILGATGTIGANFFFLSEAIISYPFYYLGIILKNSNLINKLDNRTYMLTGFILFLLLSTFTYDINTSFNGGSKVVVMASLDHGNIFLFPITAIFGSFILIIMSRLTPPNAVLRYIGQNTLWLLGINGIFYHFLNETICTTMSQYLSNDSITIFLICSLLTIFSLGLSLPIANSLSLYYQKIFYRALFSK
ncbi:MAG: acyltransferase family protein [Syntrophobacteraceae bacterium]